MTPTTLLLDLLSGGAGRYIDTAELFTRVGEPCMVIVRDVHGCQVGDAFTHDALNPLVQAGLVVTVQSRETFARRIVSARTSCLLHSPMIARWWRVA